MTMQKISLLSAALLFFCMVAAVAVAQENVTFPIDELGGCTSKESCKAYCDISENAESCASFAEAHGLVSKEEAQQIRAFAGLAGPGGCQGSECRAYCAEPAHHEECFAFAKAHGLSVPPSRAEIEARIGERTEFEPEVDEPSVDEARAMEIVHTQGGPGGCRTKEECHAFCDVEGNREICFAFATEHKLMSQEDIARARAMMSKTGPGGCTGMACKAYCENPEHGEECLQFAEEQGFIEPEEAAEARKLMSTTGPGGCRGFECKRYCEDAAHHEECFAFAVENGFVSEEEAGTVRKFMEQGGPGGCHTPEECGHFCLKHPEECGIMMSDMDEDDLGEKMHEKIDDFRPHEGEKAPCGNAEECKALFEKHGGQFPNDMMREMPKHMSPEMQKEMMEKKLHMQEMREGMSPHTSEYEGNEMHAEYEQKYDEQYKEQYEQQYEDQHQEQFQEEYHNEYEEQPKMEEQMNNTESHDEPAPQPTSLLPFSSLAAAVHLVAALLLGW